MTPVSRLSVNEPPGHERHQGVAGSGIQGDSTVDVERVPVLDGQAASAFGRQALVCKEQSDRGESFRRLAPAHVA
jgi:hypothetical protein